LLLDGALEKLKLTDFAEHDPQFQVTWLVEDEVLEGTPALGFRSVRLVGYDGLDPVTRLTSRVKTATRRRSAQAWLVLKERAKKRN
jgi:hypothetical protein